MALSSTTIKLSASSPPSRVAPEEYALQIQDAAVISLILSYFRLYFKFGLLDHLEKCLKEYAIIKSWMVVELGKNGRLEQPLALDQLFTISNIRSAVDRDVEMEFWVANTNDRLPFEALVASLSEVREIADTVLSTTDNYWTLWTKFLEEQWPIRTLSSYGFSAQSADPTLFAEIESGSTSGLWKLEKGWKPKIQIAFDLFHEQLSTSITTLASSDSLTSCFICFIKCFPDPYHLLNLPSPIEAADPSSTFTKLSEDEYDKEIKIFARYCVEGGHQRADKKFAEKERAYDEWQLLLNEIERVSKPTEWYV
jgi:hypothetical protein